MIKKNLLLLILLVSLPFSALAQPVETKQGVYSKPAFPNKENPFQFSMEIRPGEAQTETLEIKNESTDTATIKIYGTDSGTNDKGSLAFKLSTEKQSEAGRWITPLQPNINLEPDQSINTEFTVLIPPDTEPGEYLGGISVEISNIGTQTNESGGKVQVNIRKIEKVYIKVTDNPQPIEKMPPPSIPWKYYYFGGSAGIFILAITYLFISKAKKGKKEAKK
jgi:hypothetical protein